MQLVYHSRVMGTFLVSAAFLVMTHGCDKKRTNVILDVEAKTHLGEPISGAAVTLDAKPLGETDVKGLFHTEQSLILGAKPKLEIRKESDLHYFAPFIDTLLIQEEPQQKVKVDATLYFVPKPKPAGPDAVAEKPALDATSVNPVTSPPAESPGERALRSKSLEPELEAAPPTELPRTTVTQEEAALVPTGDFAASQLQVLGSLDNKAAQGDNSQSLSKEESTDSAANGQAESDVENLLAQTSGDQDGHRKPESQEKGGAGGPKVLTLNVFAKGEDEGSPIAGAQVLIGDAMGHELGQACVTNARGRCVARFSENPNSAITILVSKKGYKTAKMTVTVGESTKQRVFLERGLSLDIYALSRAYNHAEGLANLEVSINGKKVGVTDRYGHLNYVFTGRREAMVGVTIKAPGYLPEVYETDFVASGPMSVVKYFADPSPPPAKVVMIPPQLADSFESSTVNQVEKVVYDALKNAFRKHLFASVAIKEVPLSIVERYLSSAKTDFEGLHRHGWANSELRSKLDALIVPVVIGGKSPGLEISLVDNQGKVLLAEREDIDSVLDPGALDQAILVASTKMLRSFPFEGAVMGQEGEKILVNIGQSQGRGIKPGDLIDVYGIQLERLGASEQHKKIATLTVKEVLDSQSRCSVGWSAPRALVERGDLIVLRPRKVPDQSTTQIKVTTKIGARDVDVPQANVYLNSHWIGTTNETGRLYSDSRGAGVLRVVKQGYKEYVGETRLVAKGRLDISLVREMAAIKVASDPPGATVWIDEKKMGRTPLRTPIAVPSGFVKVKVESGSGYKPYTAVLELEEGTLDLTGPRTIVLEQDYLAQAQRLMREGKAKDAVKILVRVPNAHSDFLESRHQAGELWLTVLGDPEKAAALFEEVLAHESVKTFANKRFIGTHINYGMATFMAAEKALESDPEAAHKMYVKVAQSMDAVTPHLRFISGERYIQAVHTVDYHRSLARHRLGTAYQDPAMLLEAVRSWRSYLEGDVKSLPDDPESRPTVEKASVFYRQAIALLEKSKRAAQQ